MDRDFFNFFERTVAEDLIAKQSEDDRKSYAYVTRYIVDGFKRICDVDNLTSTDLNWSYTNLVPELLFMDHRSWIYFITENLLIKKIGETEQPLGLETHRGSGVLAKTTESRLGRYRKHDKDGEGDHGVRMGLMEAINKESTISFWARPCTISSTEEMIDGAKILIPSTSHKYLEKFYQDLYIKKVGQLPVLNKIKK
jgi:hypothetical protein